MSNRATRRCSHVLQHVAREHAVQRRRAYYWNRLSRSRIEADLHRRFSSVSTIPVAAWVNERFGYSHSYNVRAYTIFAEGRVDAPD